jgi:hypothetical protein
LKRLAAVQDGAIDRARQSAGDGHVRAQLRHDYRPSVSDCSPPLESNRIVAVNIRLFTPG